MNWILQILLLVTILAVLKYALGVPVSIVGSVLLFIVLSVAMMGFQRLRDRS